ncbi:MAG: transketolase [Pseudomonadota bacterium]
MFLQERQRSEPHLCLYVDKGAGHPGAPMGMADMAVALWQRHLQHNPADPSWLNRDRFVLSNGHASMLIYALLHLSGYDLPMADIEQFRQLHSKTPGHPEVDVTPGVETTTGPLGQGIGNAVGMALAEKLLADEFNQAGHAVVDHHTYAFLGDGCLMEGISHEVCALAGSLKLGKLIVLWDDNGISIDGEVGPWFSDDTPARFRAYGWQVIDGVDGHDVDAVDDAIAKAKAHADAPTLIACRTRIGQGSPNKAGTAKAHGAPLGDDEIALTRQALGWEAEPFTVPDAARAAWDAHAAGGTRQAEWQARFDAYRAAHPVLAAELERRMAGALPDGFDARCAALLDELAVDDTKHATRKASQLAITALADWVPEMLGGSADLTGSNLTNWPDCGAVRGGQPGGRHINYGVREFGMAAIMNGITLHGGYIPFGGTFLTFSDYSRNALRMAALMKRRAIHVFTHDSIGLGEDGPTHQSVEHAASLRLIPNLDVWRPGDLVETFVAWTESLAARDRPSALLLSRQGMPPQARSSDTRALIAKGGYVLADTDNPAAILIGTGSELHLAMDACATLEAEGIAVRVVSMPCLDAFQRQDADYRNSVITPGVPVAAIEAGVADSWLQFAPRERVIGMSGFGESAPGGVLYTHFGITSDALADAVRQALA